MAGNMIFSRKFSTATTGSGTNASKSSSGGSGSGDGNDVTGPPMSDNANLGANKKNHCSEVTSSRVIFVLFLVVVAACLGYGSFKLLQNAEQTLAREQFESVSDRALTMSVEISSRKRLGVRAMVGIMEETFPNFDEWPNILIKGYPSIATKIMDTTNGRSLSVLPLVWPYNMKEYEDFCYDVVFPSYGWPNTTGVSHFGKGVYALDPDQPRETERYKVSDVGGRTKWGSPYNYSFPFLYHSSSNVIAMGDMHGTEPFGLPIDQMYNCSLERALRYERNSSEPLIECGSVTDIRILNGGTRVQVKNGPGAVIFQPIYPTNNRTDIVGLVLSSLIWDQVLLNVFTNEVSGIDCILQTETQIHTYQINNGIATFLGEGDFHNPAYDDFKRTTDLHRSGLYSNFSAHYTLSFYPNEEFFEVYATNNPTTATIGSVLIILLTSCFFFLYDYFVRREFHNKSTLAKSKRQFVRFISHEVRTPLNAVSMGLQLLRDEIARLAQQKEDKTTKGTISKNSLPPLPNKNLLMNMEEKLTDWSDLSQDILTNSHSAVNVLNDILNYDKVENKSLHLELALVSIWTLIERTCNEFQLQAKACKINYILDFQHADSHSTEVEDTYPYSENDDDADEENNNKVTKANDTVVGWSNAAQLPESMSMLRVIGDNARISQTLRNLVSNALKFTPEEGTVTVLVVAKSTSSKKSNIMDTITLHNGETVTYPRSSSLIVSVSDTGAGMTKEQLRKVFAEGVQFNVNKLQAGKGSGLGMYITKGIVEQHGGTLTVTSQGPGLGSTFTMKLPLYEVPVTDEQEEKRQKKQQRREQQRGGDAGQRPAKSITGCTDSEVSEVSSSDSSPQFLNLLVVDDSAMNRKLLARLLKNQGHTVKEAEDGLVAVKRVEDATKANERFDSILMDYQMPEMDGPMACKKIRDMGCDSFIVGITGALFVEQVNHFMDCGANRVLPKPLDMNVLMDCWMEYGILK